MARSGMFSFARHLYDFTVRGGRLWMVPLLLILLVVFVLAAVGALAPYTAFLYPLLAMNDARLPTRPNAWLSPTKAVTGALLIVGLGVVWLNRVEPDDSLWCGVLLVLFSASALFTRETVGQRRWVELWAGLALFVAGAEGMMRYHNMLEQKSYTSSIMRFVDDPELKYEFQPGAQCGPHTTINELSMLDVPKVIDNPQKALRVACLGDSVGGDCELPRTNACAALEEELTALLGGRKVETLNFSVPGYNTMQEARALELKAARFEPDAVVVLYVLNDPYPDLAISNFLPGKVKFISFISTSVQAALGRVIPAADPLGRAFGRLHERERSWNGVVVRGFDRIKAFAEARSLPVVLTVFPLFVDPTPSQLEGIYEKVVAEGKRHGFQSINLAREVYAPESLTALLKPSRDIIHPDARAHQLAARAIAQALLHAHPEWKVQP